MDHLTISCECDRCRMESIRDIEVPRPPVEKITGSRSIDDRPRSRPSAARADLLWDREEQTTISQRVRAIHICTASINLRFEAFLQRLADR